jgi:hypothetical protein
MGQDRQDTFCVCTEEVAERQSLVQIIAIADSSRSHIQSAKKLQFLVQVAKER